MYDGIFLSQHCIRTEVKVLPPAEDPIATPRMSQSKVTSPCSCDHAIAKIYLQKCDDAGNFAGAQFNRGHDPLIDFIILTSAFVRSHVLEVVYRTSHSVQHERLMENPSNHTVLLQATPRPLFRRCSMQISDSNSAQVGDNDLNRGHVTDNFTSAQLWYGLCQATIVPS